MYQFLILFADWSRSAPYSDLQDAVEDAGPTDAILTVAPGGRIGNIWVSSQDGQAFDILLRDSESDLTKLIGANIKDAFG